jgi:NAD(P)-dependent dehydrogenase (short-subunit alcohol dehydrogenase family)
MVSVLSGQKILIVGGSSGIGLATALAAAHAKAKVTIASRSRVKLAKASEQCLDCFCVAQLDTGDSESLERFFAEEEPFDHIVISSAATKGGPVKQLALVDAYASMESKFWGAYRIARAAKIKQDGSLTVVSGFLSSRPSATSVLQGAINAALEGLVRGLALEFSPVRVNAVSPGLIDTPLYSGMDAARKEELFTSTRNWLPAKRIGQASDVADAILLAATNRFMTGSVITVDGGGTIA